MLAGVMASCTICHPVKTEGEEGGRSCSSVGDRRLALTSSPGRRRPSPRDAPADRSPNRFRQPSSSLIQSSGQLRNQRFQLPLLLSSCVYAGPCRRRSRLRSQHDPSSSHLLVRSVAFMAQQQPSPSVAFRQPYLPRSSSMTAGEEYELASPPAAGGSSRELPPFQSSVDLSDAAGAGRSPTQQQQGTRRTRGLSIHRLARQPTSLLFEHFHSPDAVRRALPSNFLHEDDEPTSSGGGGLHDARRPDNAILHGLGMDDDPYDVARDMQSAWKRKVFLTMEEPTSSEEALMIHWGVTALIVFSWAPFVPASNPLKRLIPSPFAAPF